MSKPFKCHNCKTKLGLFFSDRLHVHKHEMEAIFRRGEVTLVCPKCGTLNEAYFGSHKEPNQ